MKIAKLTIIIILFIFLFKKYIIRIYQISHQINKVYLNYYYYYYKLVIYIYMNDINDLEFSLIGSMSLPNT